MTQHEKADGWRERMRTERRRTILEERAWRIERHGSWRENLRSAAGFYLIGAAGLMIACVTRQLAWTHLPPLLLAWCALVFGTGVPAIAFYRRFPTAHEGWGVAWMYLLLALITLIKLKSCW